MCLKVGRTTCSEITTVSGVDLKKGIFPQGLRTLSAAIRDLSHAVYKHIHLWLEKCRLEKRSSNAHGGSYGQSTNTWYFGDAGCIHSAASYPATSFKDSCVISRAGQFPDCFYSLGYAQQHGFVLDQLLHGSGNQCSDYLRFLCGR